MGGKRGRDLDDGRAVAMEIVRLQDGDRLIQCDKVTRLPYPGLGRLPGPLELNYVGNPFVLELYRVYKTEKYRHGVVITGPEGYGKSSDLRAFAVHLYRFSEAQVGRQRLVSIWSMDAALDGAAQVVQDALLFAYMVPYELEKLQRALKHADDKETNAWAVQPALEAEIRKINSVDDAVEFIRRRKREHQEYFLFFVDGWEVVDEKDWNGVTRPRKKQRTLVHNQLARQFFEGEVWLTASAMSNAANYSRDAHVLYKTECFDELQFATYAASGVLGKLPRRERDIEFFTGHVPLFLNVLCDCCMEFSRKTLSLERKWREPDGDDECEADPTLDQIAELLANNDANWDAVLALFKKHRELKRVEASAKSADRSCRRTCDMGKKDATYFNPQTAQFCSDYVETIYRNALEEAKRLM